MPYKRILIALSCEGNEKPLLKEAFTFKDAFDASLTVIHVNRPHAGEMSMMMDSEGVRYDEGSVKKIIEDFGFSPNDVTVVVTQEEYVKNAISKAAVEYDLLIVGHRGVGPFLESISDTLDEEIINRVHCPVLVVPKS
ncbi:MAG: universal stress protein [Fidelibacterota bacterium]